MIRANQIALSLCVTGSVLASGTMAAADEPEVQAAPNYKPFAEGRQLAASGQYADAITKFLESEAIEPAPGTMANLAFCYERLGQITSAWISYKATARLARETSKFAWATRAEISAADLEKSAPKVNLDVHPNDIGDLELWLDDIEIPKVLWMESIPVVRGQHALRATASGQRDWSTSFEVDSTAASRIVVPPLEPIPAPPMAAPTLVQLPRKDASLPQNGQSGLRRSSAWIMGGAGVTSLLAGSILAISSKNTYSSSEPDCARVCTSAGSNLRSTAISEANAATVLFALGAAAAVGGVVLWWSSGTPSQPGLRVTPSLAAKQAAISISGNWQ